MQSGLVVEIVILASVKNVESGYPEGNGSAEEEDAGIERGTHRDPGSCRSDAEGESEHQVRPAGKTLGVRIQQNYGESDWGESEREAIELGGGDDEYRTGDDHEHRDEAGR